MNIVEVAFRLAGLDYDNGVRCGCEKDYKECPAKIQFESGRMVRKHIAQCGKFQKQAEAAQKLVNLHKGK